ncbi:MAG: AAA family ATPase [Desulfurococcaceae archaeon]
MARAETRGALSMNISRLHVKNFLSLRNVEVPLGKLNVFIGPNGSGKSNIVKAIQLLENHARFGYPTLGGTEIPFTDMVYNFDNYSTMEFHVELSREGEEAIYSLLVHGNGFKEKMLYKGMLYKSHVTIYESESESGKFVLSYLSSSNVFRSPSIYISQAITYLLRRPDGTVERRPMNLVPSLLRDPPADAHNVLVEASETLRRFRAFRLSPDSIRGRSDVTFKPDVEHDGGNLARYLLDLYLEERRTFDKVEDVVRSLVPEVDELVPHIEGTSIELYVKVKGLKLPLRPGFISDGTLRLVAFAELLHGGFSLVAMEGPENYVHPRLLEALVDLARRSPSQVVFTTHSPRLLDFVKPEEVFLVSLAPSEAGTETVVRRLADAKEMEVVKRFLEEGGTLGEAWISGMFEEGSNRS